MECNMFLTFEGLSMFASLTRTISRNPWGSLSDLLLRRFPARFRTKFSSSSSSSSLPESVLLKQEKNWLKRITQHLLRVRDIGTHYLHDLKEKTSQSFMCTAFHWHHYKLLVAFLPLLWYTKCILLWSVACTPVCSSQIKCQSHKCW